MSTRLPSPSTSPVPPAALPHRLRAWWPAPLAVDRRERARVAVGAGLGLLLAGGLCLAVLWLLERLVPGPLVAPAGATLPWLVAPLGASAVLVFGLPASPLAQPWSVVGGNTVSALVGIAVTASLPWPVLAAPLAVALAIVAMFALRCLHPPGGAVALLMVLAGFTQPQVAAFPVLANSVLLVAAGLAYNRATGRRYPHAQLAAALPVPGAPGAASRFSDADIDAALRSYNQLSHLPRDDLQAMLEQAEVQAHGRRLAALRCSDIMSHEPVTVHFGSSLQEAWMLLRDQRIKALPVIDRARRVVGVVTLADFMRDAELDLHQGFDKRLRRLLRASPFSHSDKPEVVGQIMTRVVRVANAERSLADLVPLFATTGHHHIPVVDGEARLVGVVTQTDLVRALLRFAVQ